MSTLLVLIMRNMSRLNKLWWVYAELDIILRKHYMPLVTC